MVINLIKYSVLVLLSVFINVEAQNIEATAETDTSDYYVGDYISYQIALSYDNNIKILGVAVKDSLKKLELIKEENPQKSTNENTNEVFMYTLAGYDSSEITIPGIPVYYSVGNDTSRRTLLTNPVKISVHTVPIDPSAEIMDVKEPVKIPLNWIIIIIVVFILLAISIAFYWWYRNYKKKKAGNATDIPKVIIPPDKIAINELRELEEKKLWQQNLVKEYHSEVTGIIRKYFEARFNILALEMPSSDLLNELKSINDAQVIFDSTKSFLENADMVKFAKFQPMPTVNEEMLKQAYSIVEKTRIVETASQKEKEAERV